MNTGIPFFKMTGSGNDFVFLDGRETSPDQWPASTIQSVCARRTGVGADGLVILEPVTKRSLRFHYFNADGSRGELCGNAALCAARLGPTIGLVETEAMTLCTDSGEIQTEWDPELEPDAASITMVAASDVMDRAGDVHRGPDERHMWSANVGVPHLVVVVTDNNAPAANPAVRGRDLRLHAAFRPAGTNVNFIHRTPRGWSIRTYERGVEGETLACGTGAVAAAAVLKSLGLEAVGGPVNLETRSGSVLRVSPASQTGHVRLSGGVRTVYQGVLELAAWK